MAEPAPKDLIVLVADKDMKLGLEGLLKRPGVLGIRPITHDVFPHPQHDPACLLRGHEFLRSFSRQYAHALVVFDREGCGSDKVPDALQSVVEGHLRGSGWSDRAAAVVIDPELDMWVWSDSPHVDSILGWQGRQPALRDWLVQVHKDYWAEGEAKPRCPKKALLAALYEARKPRTAAIYQELAARVSVQRCMDAAFLRLLHILRKWFPPAA